MDYFGDMVVFKNYNGFIVFSLLISISLFHDLLINLSVGLHYDPIGYGIGIGKIYGSLE